jgi:outer membrane protein assembly factor BamB
LERIMTEHMMKARHRTLIGISILAGFTAVLAGQGAAPDWPQWRGPNRDGAVASFEEPASWPALLTLRWKVEVGLGYATPIVVDNRVYMFARQTGPFTRQTGNEVMLALDADTGKAIWQTGYPALFSLNSIMGPVARSHREGPKSTPTFANGRLYTLGMTGVVTALDAATGQQLWQKPASPVLPLYHTAMSPLVDRGLVILHVGGHDQGALTAFDAITGDVKWSWNGDGPAYASPIVAEFESVRQVITFTQDNLIGVAAATGELLWRRPFATQGVQNIITPILYGQTVIVSGTGKGVTAFRVTRQDNQWVTENAWDNQEVSLYMSNAVIARDALFGLSERNRGNTSRSTRKPERRCGPAIDARPRMPLSLEPGTCCGR